MPNSPSGDSSATSARDEPSARAEPKKLNIEGSAAAYESEKYVATLETLRDTLDKYGVAILPSLLDEGEVKEMNDGMWTTLEEMTSQFSGSAMRIDRGKHKTWPSIEELKPAHGYLIQTWGIGHAKYVWDVRANSKVCDAFAAVHDTNPEELITSYDAVSILLPDGQRGKTRTSPELWLHTDQRFNYEFEPYRNSVQAWLTGFDVADGSATLAFMEGSHRFHAAFGEHFGCARHAFNWFQLQHEEEFTFLHEKCGCPLKAISCPAGSMVLFDSRLFHSGMAPPSGSQPVPRHVVYVCMTPRQWCKESDLIRRREHYFNGRMTAHTPHVPSLFGMYPRGYGKDSLPVNAPSMYTAEQMSERMKTLIPLEVPSQSAPEDASGVAE